MNYYSRHLGDYAKDTSHLSMLEHGAYTLLLDKYYTSETGIPEDQVYRVAHARTGAERKAVDAVLREFFTLTEGVWTKGRVEEEIQHYRDSIPAEEAKKANDRERQRRSRERRRQLFDQLRESGIVLPFNTPNTELQTHLSRLMSQQGNGGVTRDNTASQSPITNLQIKSGSAARADEPGDPRARLFDLGVQILGESGRSLISKAIKHVGEEEVGAVLGQMALSSKADPRAYFVAATKPKETRLVV